MGFVPTIRFKTLAVIAAAAMAGWLAMPVLTAHPALGEHPLCEGSAAALVACPGGTGKCLLVGDNEQSDQLFAFPLSSEGITRDKQSPVPLPTNKPIDDIEALVMLPDNRLLVMGSHSRNTSCEAKKGKKRRRRFAVLKLPLGTPPLASVVKSKRLKCSNLFPSAPGGDIAMQAACAAIDNAEQQAQQLEDDFDAGKVTEKDAGKRCGEIQPFNAEGAVAVGNDVWVGLRAPLVAKLPGDDAQRDLAILMHLKGHDAWAFDRVVLLDLGQFGIRDLASDGKYIWIIAGPANDAEKDHQLRRFETKELAGSSVISPEIINKKLPAYSEGLALIYDNAYVVIDGDTGKDEDATTCIEPTRLFELDLR